MIFVLLECSAMECSSGGEYVDVYYNDWAAGTPISKWLPEGWNVTADDAGLPVVLCPECVSVGVLPTDAEATSS